MEKIKILSIVLSFLFCVSCGDKKPSIDNASIEPNDNIEEANTISLGTEFSMAINPKGDVDWYQVEVKGQGYLQVLTRNVPDNLDVQVRFATYDEWGSKNENFLTDYLKTPCAIPIYDDSTYYIMVCDRWGANFSEEEFFVKFDFIEEFDNYEPNNKPASAYKVEFGKEYQSAIFPKADEDWFMVEVKEQGYLQVKAKNIPDNVELTTYFATYDEYSKPKTNTLRAKLPLPNSVAITEPGEYYIVFADRWNNKESQQLFTWTVDFLPEMDIYEPNNKFTDAKETGLNDTLQIAIYPVGDNDFFKFIPEKKGKLTVRANPPGNLEVAVRIHKLDSYNDNKLKTFKNFTTFPFEFEIEEVDTEYYIEFYDRWSRYQNPELFKVFFEFK